MMKIVAFDVKSSVAHFRRPDTTATHLTYPFISPTAAKGLVGAILGITDFVTRDQVGIELLSPVRMVSQQLSLLGKGGGNVFNRPTTIQLLIQPSYRIYYGGDEYVDDLESYLKNDQMVYPTYLGSGFALTKPIFVHTWEGKPISHSSDPIATKGVIPIPVIDELIFQPNQYFQRAGGFFQKYLGERQFGESIDFIYEENRQTVMFKPKPIQERRDYAIVQVAGDVICLV